MNRAALADLEIGVARPPERGAALEVLANALSQSERPAAATIDPPVAEPSACVLVARSGGHVVGVLLMTAATAGPWRVGPIAVVPRCRGGGIGTSLMQVCRARLDAAGEAAVVTTSHLPAVTFFGRFGFTAQNPPTGVGAPRWSLRRPASRSRKEQSP